ncbi:hypothetical protein BD309DRAFT_967030 [Dichomitus squalens]|nr:hypothetical protein BD309DRAFT_967030 [Dichomitus squalens]
MACPSRSGGGARWGWWWKRTRCWLHAQLGRTWPYKFWPRPCFRLLPIRPPPIVLVAVNALIHQGPSVPLGRW